MNVFVLLINCDVCEARTCGGRWSTSRDSRMSRMRLAFETEDEERSLKLTPFQWTPSRFDQLHEKPSFEAPCGKPPKHRKTYNYLIHLYMFIKFSIRIVWYDFSIFLISKTFASSGKLPLSLRTSWRLRLAGFFRATVEERQQYITRLALYRRWQHCRDVMSGHGSLFRKAPALSLRAAPAPHTSLHVALVVTRLCCDDNNNNNNNTWLSNSSSSCSDVC